jgi:predicted nucleic acid-binding protein
VHSRATWAESAPLFSLGELRLGILQATSPEIASVRLSTYELARRFHPLPIDERLSAAWAALVASLQAMGRRMPVNDSWIAATAIANGVPVVTQDADYDDVPKLTVLRI